MSLPQKVDLWFGRYCELFIESIQQAEVILLNSAMSKQPEKIYEDVQIVLNDVRLKVIESSIIFGQHLATSIEPKAAIAGFNILAEKHILKYRKIAYLSQMKALLSGKIVSKIQQLNAIYDANGKTQFINELQQLNIQLEKIEQAISQANKLIIEHDDKDAFLILGELGIQENGIQDEECRQNQETDDSKQYQTQRGKFYSIEKDHPDHSVYVDKRQNGNLFQTQTIFASFTENKNSQIEELSTNYYHQDTKQVIDRIINQQAYQEQKIDQEQTIHQKIELSKFESNLKENQLFSFGNTELGVRFDNQQEVKEELFQNKLIETIHDNIFQKAEDIQNQETIELFELNISHIQEQQTQFNQEKIDSTIQQQMLSKIHAETEIETGQFEFLQKLAALKADIFKGDLYSQYETMKPVVKITDEIEAGAIYKDDEDKFNVQGNQEISNLDYNIIGELQSNFDEEYVQEKQQYYQSTLNSEDLNKYVFDSLKADSLQTKTKIKNKVSEMRQCSEETQQSTNNQAHSYEEAYQRLILEFQKGTQVREHISLSINREQKNLTFGNKEQLMNTYCLETQSQQDIIKGINNSVDSNKIVQEMIKKTDFGSLQQISSEEYKKNQNLENTILEEIQQQTEYQKEQVDRNINQDMQENKTETELDKLNFVRCRVFGSKGFKESDKNTNEEMKPEKYSFIENEEDDFDLARDESAEQMFDSINHKPKVVENQIRLKYLDFLPKYQAMSNNDQQIVFTLENYNQETAHFQILNEKEPNVSIEQQVQTPIEILEEPIESLMDDYPLLFQNNQIQNLIEKQKSNALPPTKNAPSRILNSKLKIGVFSQQNDQQKTQNKIPASSNGIPSKRIGGSSSIITTPIKSSKVKQIPSSNVQEESNEISVSKKDQNLPEIKLLQKQFISDSKGVVKSGNIGASGKAKKLATIVPSNSTSNQQKKR